MPKFTPTRRGNSCVICQSFTGKCREHQDGEIFLCMSFADARLGEVQNGYKCIKPANGGNWATFKLDNTEEWSEELRQEWQQKNQQRQQQKTKDDEQRQQRSLSALDRDKAYRQLLGELVLHPDDKADLVRRGFSHAQIELSGFRSIERYQQLQGCYSDLLPGVNRNNRLIIRDEGYLCPIRNAEGLIVACQVRLRTLPNTESSRYRWLSGHGQVLHLFPDGCKPDGELPLAVHLPEKLGKLAIGICEGTGAKPFLAAQKLGIPFVGAAGGQHAGSEVILKSTLQQIEKTLWQVAQETGLNSTNNQQLQCLANKEKLATTETYHEVLSTTGIKPENSVTEKQLSCSISSNFQWLRKRLLESLQTNLNSIDSSGKLSKILNWESAEYQSHYRIELILTPDAGSLINKQVMSRWQQVTTLLEKWGYQVKFAWWGQVDKSQPDIDELENFSIIEYISPHEFFKKGDESSWVEPLKKLETESKPSVNPIERSKALCQPSMGFNPYRNYKKISCQNGEDQVIRVLSTSQTYEKLNGSSNLSVTLSSQGNSKDVILTSSTIQEYVASISPDQLLVVDETEAARRLGISDNTPEWKRKAHANWRKNRQFTSAIKSCDQWCQWTKPSTNTMFFGRAGLGRGKTTLLKKWVAEWKKAGNGFLCLGYRNTLLLQLCEQLGAYHLHDKEASLMRADGTAGIALCVDSLWRFSPEDFDDKIIILDEVQSVIKHILHSSTVRNRDKILDLFHEAIKRSKQVICLDGLMADWCVDYLHTICPEKQIIKAENTYQGKKPVINHLLGTIVEGEENGKIKVNDRSPWFKYLMENSSVPVVCSDSQALIEALDNIFSERGLKVLRIDSKTVPESYVKECLKDCNTYIEEHKPDVLLYTPSAESGVDVSIPDYFTEHFAFFFGVLDVDSMLQMLGRIRDDITKYVWCKSFVSTDEKQLSKSPFADTIQKSLNQLLLSDVSTSISSPETWNQEIVEHLTKIIAESNNVDTRLSTLIQSIQNFEKSNLRECLKEALLESGYTVKDCTLESSNHGGKAKEETEAVKRQNANDIFKAEKIPFELLKELGFDSKWEDRCKVMQARLRERLPGIEETDTWNEDFVYLTKYGDRDFISHQEMFWLFNNPEIAKQQSQKHFHRMAKRLKTFIGNYKSRWAKIHALHQIGLPEFLDSADEWINDSPGLTALTQKAREHSIVLGYQGKQSNIQFLSKLLALIGLKLKSRKIGEKIRCYHIDRDVLNDPVRLQVLACIERKFTETPTENLTQSDWENAKNEAHGILRAEGTQTQSEQDVQAQTVAPQFVYRNEGATVCQNLEEKSQKNGGVLEAVVQESELEQLVEALPFVETADEFAAVIEGSPTEVVEDAIALSGNQPRRRQLEQWHQALKTSERPPLAHYTPGDEVWAYFPQSQDGWLKGKVEWVRGKTIRVVSGFFGIFIGREDAIAPGDWIMSS